MIIKRCTTVACLLFTLHLTLSAKVPQAHTNRAPGTLTGKVLDPPRLYIPGATISVRGRRFRREIWSGADGTYSIDLPPGMYSVRIGHYGFYPFRKRVHIKSHGVTTLDVVLNLNPRFETKTVIKTRRG